MGMHEDFHYFIDHQDELVKLYNGKILAIKDGVVLGAYDSVKEAIIETKKTHAPGTFLIQQCEPGPEAYTQTFHSRVSFAGL